MLGTSLCDFNLRLEVRMGGMAPLINCSQRYNLIRNPLL